MRKLYFVLVTLVASATIYVYVGNSPTQTENIGDCVAMTPNADATSRLDVDHERDNPSDIGAPESADSGATQLVRSIHDFGLDYRTNAVQSAEEMMQHWDQASYVRWEAIYVDPKLHLKGSYLNGDAMPETMTIAPFPDISVVADKKSYLVMPHIPGAIWRGSIRGTENGEVELSIVGSTQNPSFVIRFLHYPNLIRINPSDDAGDYYIALEINPHKFVPSSQHGY